MPGGRPLNPLEEELRARIARHGPLPFSAFQSAALLHPDHGFFTAGGGAGRRAGDFLTSPEVGPLFGAVLARALDTWWEGAGRPAPFVVVEGGAGRGALALAVRQARPACAAALTWVLVEASPALRAAQAEHLTLTEPALALADPGDGPRFVSLGELPRVGHAAGGVVVANELLDDLPVDLLERAGTGWTEVRVGWDDVAGTLAEVVVPTTGARAALADELAPGAEPGARIPLQDAAADWLRDALATVAPGRVVVVDYADTTAGLAARDPATWLRTYRGHERGGPPLARPGTQDVTCDVALDQLARVRSPAADRRQRDFLLAHGVEELVAEGRRVWAERGSVGDLDALRHRSRVAEAEALLDPGGLGAFHVVEWVVP